MCYVVIFGLQVHIKKFFILLLLQSLHLWGVFTTSRSNFSLICGLTINILVFFLIHYGSKLMFKFFSLVSLPYYVWKIEIHRKIDMTNECLCVYAWLGRRLKFSLWTPFWSNVGSFFAFYFIDYCFWCWIWAYELLPSIWEVYICKVFVFTWFGYLFTIFCLVGAHLQKNYRFIFLIWPRVKLCRPSILPIINFQKV